MNFFEQLAVGLFGGGSCSTAFHTKTKQGIKPMDNQHRKIKGYRELSQEEIDLMNKVKEKGEEFRQLICEVNEINNKLAGFGNAEEQELLANSESARWENIAKTHLQQGLIALTRAIAKPGFF